MTYSYDYPHPAVTTDIAAFAILDNALKVLLIRRAHAPFKGKWALPGGFLDLGEDLEACARRELKEETGLSKVYLEQLYTFGAVRRDPRERVISVAYYALVPGDGGHARPGDDASETRWFGVDSLPKLAFDHDKILKMAVARLAAKMDYSTVGLQFMPKEFPISRLMRVYELAGQRQLDKRNFRKWILAHDLIEETGRKMTDGPFRPAMLYRVKNRSRVENIR